MGKKVNAVQKMQDYIEKNITKKFTFYDFEKESLYSPWNAIRWFLEYTGLSFSDYIRKLKLTLSTLNLRDKNIRITDAAFDFGFINVDGFQRAFKKEFGCNLKEYEKNPMPISFFTPYGVNFRYLDRKKIELDVKNIIATVIEKEERKIVIKRGI